MTDSKFTFRTKSARTIVTGGEYNRNYIDGIDRNLMAITSGTITPGQEPYYHDVSIAITFPGVDDNKKEYGNRLVGLVELVSKFS